MATTPRPRTPRERARADRERPSDPPMPEPGTPEFAAEARRQSLLVASSPQEEEDQAFVDSISDVFSDDGLAG